MNQKFRDERDERRSSLLAYSPWKPETVRLEEDQVPKLGQGTPSVLTDLEETLGTTAH